MRILVRGGRGPDERQTRRQRWIRILVGLIVLIVVAGLIGFIAYANDRAGRPRRVEAPPAAPPSRPAPGEAPPGAGSVAGRAGVLGAGIGGPQAVPRPWVDHDGVGRPLLTADRHGVTQRA